MNKLITSLLLALPLAASPALAQDKKEPGKQQSKMAECNKAAEGKKGDERKAFMKSCLSDKKKAQQDKMKACNKDAAGKKGDERKAFMKDCLSK
ncbi:MAG: PsiF repeat protein [Burkholderiales bacterium]|nr:PsiF repeat protein [Burkholderiales bacterium]